MYVKGHKIKVHIMRPIQQKPHYISQNTLPLTIRLLSHNQNYSLFFVTSDKG